MRNVIISVIALAVIIYFHSDITRFLVDLKLSFTFSKMLPYVLELSAIISIIFFVNTRLLKGRPHNTKRLSAVAIFLVAGGIAFAFNPIYEGDFDNTYQEIYFSGQNEDAIHKGLNLIAQPGCPYCYMRIAELNKMKELYPFLTVNVLVTNSDTLAFQDYKEFGHDDFTFDFFPSEVANVLQIHEFPTLFYKPSKDAKDIVKWSNNGFGSAAWDYVIKRERN